ncbi:MAG TPA: NADH-quinone oxidoreductase subunit C [Acidimicrobiales bacterium]|nr:NADH-quinone oxidoreductase subunit C [Acidimicrobiales bacterium]
MSEVEQQPADEAVEAQAAPEPELVHGAPVAWSHGQQVVHVTQADYLDVLTALKADGFDACMDLCAVDYLAAPARPLPEGVEPGRYEVVVNLLSTTHRRRLRVRAQVPADDPVLPSLFDLWAGTEAMEREAFDMMGITFDNHPDLTRILMPEDWEGHPLRKDYAVGRVPVQFKHPVSSR